MLINMLLFEIKYQFRKPATHVFALLMFMLAFLFLSTDAASFGGAGPLIKANSPYVLSQIFLTMSIIGLIILPGVTGTSVIRDMEMKTHEVLYATPLTKFAYIGGRFIGTYCAVMFIYSAAVVGALLGTMVGPAFGWINADKIGDPYLMYYLMPQFVFVATNAFLFAAISFGVGLLFRSFIAVYVQGFALLILWSVSQNFTREIENRTLAAILDPMGFRAFSMYTEFWTPIEKNTQLIGFTGEILINRLVWMGVAAVIFAIAYSLFKMNVQGITLRKSKKKSSIPVEPAAPAQAPHQPTLVYGLATSIKQYLALSKLYIASIIREKPFAAIALIGLMNFGINAYYANHTENMDLQPVTYLMIDTMRNVFTIFSLIISTLYAGELVWKERSIRLAQTFDALPMPVWVGIAGKLTALTAVQVVITIIMIFGAILTQLFQGYTNFELGQYLQYLCMIALPTYLLTNIVALTIHVLVNQKYVGHMVVILFYIFKIVASELGFEHRMWDFGSSRFGIYSDMNGWAPFYERGFSYLLFFLAVGAVLTWIATSFTVRGTEDRWKLRLRSFRARMSKPSMTFASSAMMLSLGYGGFIYYNTNFLNVNKTSDQTEEETVKYEKTYGHLRSSLQPKITALYVNCELHPYEHWYTMSGVQTLKNRESVPIDSLIVSYNQDLTLNRLTFNRQLTLLLNDTVTGVKIYKFVTPLAPGDSMKVDFSIGHYRKGFNNTNINTRIIDNGTFLYTDVAPSYGYIADAEMSDPSDRKKYGLPVKERIPSITNDKAKNESYITAGADLIDFEAVVSTAPDQIAIAPGYLQKEWTESTQWGQRKFFHYKMDQQIWNFVAILSGKYAVARDVWMSPEGKKVNLEVYYHPGHDYNIANFMESAKGGLDYYSKNFSPYQHSQYRVIEFPRYESFAQAFPNTIPFSESMQFIARQDKDPNTDNIDFGFFVNAHELGHQWWAHQVLGSNQQGCTIMSESLAEYSALRVMEKKYGQAMTQKFLRYELDGYLRGRSNETRAEQPIAYNENQSYIHYNKGSHTFYCLADYIGEDTLNAALAEFIRTWGGKFRPYPNSRDLLPILRKHTPDSLQGLVTDLFEKITLYSNEIASSTAKKNPDGTYAVTVNVKSNKFYSDSVGNQTKVPLADWIDIGIFAKSKKGTLLDNPLYFKKHKITAETMQFTFTVKEQPIKVGIDPFYKLVDRSPDDNVKSVEVQ
ncbi:MAG: hypothetical protein IPM69_10380 [Ignavibacteria bacterium]|nr:hypothetical protein [Ignavibacteria bacterium]